MLLLTAGMHSCVVVLFAFQYAFVLVRFFVLCVLLLFFFFLRIRQPPRSPLFPYTTLFRSVLIETPTYSGTLAVLAGARVRALGVPVRTESGPGMTPGVDVSAIEAETSTPGVMPGPDSVLTGTPRARTRAPARTASVPE